MSLYSYFNELFGIGLSGTELTSVDIESHAVARADDLNRSRAEFRIRHIHNGRAGFEVHAADQVNLRVRRNEHQRIRIAERYHKITLLSVIRRFIIHVKFKSKIVLIFFIERHGCLFA